MVKPKKIVWIEDLKRFLLNHSDDILLDMEDFGALRSVYNHFFTVMQGEHKDE